ncbi:MAG: methionyl-tRNA formyltransferase [Gammaproteobacteria bacterium]|nr:methionyl-tRNA formyltransferase [Gammaproteobacteria bacterium]
MRILFAGTPEFAAQHLRALLDSPHRLVGVLTQPDRPAGRGRRLAAGPVRRLAEAHGLPLLQPPSLRSEDTLAPLRAWAPDVMVVVAYGLLLPQVVLDIPARGCLNVHASLLPRWRGAAPIQRAILAGDRETGVSVMHMEAGLDSGPVYLQSPCPIHATDTAGDLHDRLARLGPGALLVVLGHLEAGTARTTAQDDSRATYAAKLHKSEARLDWQQSAAAIDRAVRAFNPWPVAHCYLGDTLLRIWDCMPLAVAAGAPPGTISNAGPEGLTVATGDDDILITRLQLAGGRPMAVADYLHAHADPTGARLKDAPV